MSVTVHCVAVVLKHEGGVGKFILEFTDRPSEVVSTGSWKIQNLLKSFIAAKPKPGWHLYVALVQSTVIAAAEGDDLESLFKTFGFPKDGLLPIDAEPLAFSSPITIPPELLDAPDD